MPKVVMVVGVWMLLSPLLIASPAIASWNLWLAGGFGVASGALLARGHWVWQGTLAIIAGACLFVAGFIPRLHAGEPLVGASVIFGTLLVIAGASAIGHRHAPGPAVPRVN
jgi:hypothetical protein